MASVGTLTINCNVHVVAPNCSGRHCAHDLECFALPPHWIETFEPPSVPDLMTHCPCRHENGGSGICGCVLGGFQITC